ncbi:MAG TPA: hypothetical protein VIY28_03045 [Pseudonocardiaceae bacterium]
MSDAMSCAELDGQQVELLPARTVLSLFTMGSTGSDGGHGASGSDGQGFIELNSDVLPLLGQSNSAGSGIGGHGGAAGGAPGGTD